MAHNVEFKVGMFIIVTSVLIASFIGYVAYKKGVFETELAYVLSSKSGDNLTEGMPVVFSGFKIGRVDSLELNPDGLVIVKIKVPQRHTRWLRQGSVFVLEKPLIGAARIIVATADLKSPALPESVVSQIVEVNDINEAIKSVKPILEKIYGITYNIESLTSTLADPGGDMNKILRNAKNASEQIDGILKKVDAMSAKTDERLYGADGVLVQVQTILIELTGKLRKLDPVLENINKISVEATDVTKDMKSLRQDIDSMLDEVNTMLKNIDALIPFKKEPQTKLP